MKTVIIKIEGMSCLDCAIRVQRALAAVPSVKCVYVAVGVATVKHEDASEEQLLQAVRTAGNYRGVVEPPRLAGQIQESRKVVRTTIKAIAELFGARERIAGESNEIRRQSAID